jgi:hypothetical protein
MMSFQMATNLSGYRGTLFSPGKWFAHQRILVELHAVTKQ